MPELLNIPGFRVIEELGSGSLSTVYKADSPQLFVDVNREACLKQGVALDELFGTLQAYLGFGNLCAVLQIGDMPHERTLKNMELFAREVMPALAGNRH